MARKICENCGQSFYSDDEEEFYCSEVCEKEANGEDGIGGVIYGDAK